jgi:seryl-tRNA synthetase
MPTQMPHSLNSTLIAIERGLTCILENYQQEDGTILVPDVLQQYTGFSQIKGKKRKKK